MKKQSLGRGLGALIPTSNSDTNSTLPKDIDPTLIILELDLTNIVPNDHQPRTVFDPQLLNELAESIKNKGVIQPIIVTKLPDQDKYMIIEGERRWRASGLASKKTIPAIFRKVDNESDRLELALITNAQRENLNPVELAKAYKRLMHDYSYRQEDLSVIMGKSRSAVANRLRLLNLPVDVLNAIEDKLISEGHGRALLSLENKDLILEQFRNIIDKELTVRDVEKNIQKMNKQSTEGQSNNVDKSIDPHILDISKEFEGFFSSKVNIKDKAGSGTIEIKYISYDDLDRITKRIRGEI